MKILSIKLHKFRRMPLIDSDTVTIDFTKKLNLIFGTNGSGKSKLMKELSPLPSDKDDFYPGGYKYIVIEHRDKTYKINNDFGDKSKFSFVVEDEELNNGGTITVQKDLVFQHFGIDQDIHDILIGATTFTGMNTVVRKKLFNLVSNINIEYVLDVYERLRENHREKLSQLKVQTNLMEMETLKLVNPLQEETIKKEVALTKETLDGLLVIRSMTKRDAGFITRDAVQSHLADLKSSINALTKVSYMYLTSYSSKELLEGDLETNHKAQLGIIDHQFKSCYRSLEGYMDAKHALEVQMVESSGDLRVKLTEIDKQIFSKQKGLIYFKDSSIVSDVHKELTSVQYTLMETLREMPENESRYISKNAYIHSITDKDNKQVELNSIEKSLFKLHKDLEHVTDHLKNDITTCPSCKFQWNINYTSDHVVSIKNDIEKLNKKRKELEDSIDKIKVYLEKCVAYFTMYKIVLSARTGTYTLLKPLWDEVDSNDTIMKNPTRLIVCIEDGLRDTMLLSDIENLEKKKKSLLDLLQIAETKVTSDVASILKGIEDEEVKVKNLSDKRKENLSALEDIKNAKYYYERLNRLYSDFKKAEAQLNDVADLEAAEALITLIDDVIRDNKLKLLELQTKLEATDKIHYLITKYKQQISDIQDHVLILDAMLKELSPKNGIIAKSIGGFINRLISNMNSIIEPIWSYGFSIVPYDVENDEKLDYRFKVNVAEELATPDVTKTSGGMREIIDQAFRMTVMKFLRLTDWPLMLDEFGIRLDAYHRSRLHSLIISFIADETYSQIFLITHQDMSYSNSRDSDVIVVSSENITYKDARNILMLS